MSDEETDSTKDDVEEIFKEMVDIAEKEGVIDSATADDYKKSSRNVEKEDVRKVSKGFAKTLISDKDTDEEEDVDEEE